MVKRCVYSIILTLSVSNLAWGQEELWLSALNVRLNYSMSQTNIAVRADAFDDLNRTNNNVAPTRIPCGCEAEQFERKIPNAKEIGTVGIETQ